MGIFKKKKKQKKDNSEYIMPQQILSRVIEDSCKQIKMLERQHEETKQEYSEVTAYLSDIQRINDIPDSERVKVEEAALSIINVNNERQEYKNTTKRLSDENYRRMEMYESQIPGEIKRMGEQERYLSLIQNDMHHIEGEKGSIKYAKEKAQYKRDFLKKFSYAVCFTVAVIFIILLVITKEMNRSFMIPFFITGVLSLIYIAYFVIEMRNTSAVIRQADREMNRAVTLMNKIKIKCVNTTNVLDYSYEKYGVNSFHELSYMWEAYNKDKEDEQQYKKNTRMLSSCFNTLLSELNKWQLEYSDIWVHQPKALLDKKEMVEVRHSLNERRQKLRAQLDFNMRQQDTAHNELESLKAKYKDDISLIQAVMDEYRIK